MGHVGEDEVLEVELFERPQGIENGTIGPYDERTLLIGWLALMTC